MIQLRRLIEHRRLLAEPMASAAGRWTERRALLIVVEHEGQIGLGEAAPLPGYSDETLESAREAIRALRGKPLNFGATRSNSANAAVETAMFDMGSRSKGVPAWALIPELAPDPAAPNAEPPEMALSLWLPDQLERALAAARAALERGVRCFKVKLTPGSDSGLATLTALRKEHGNAIVLRADANQSLSREELEQKLPALRELRLEWLEEPTRPPLETSLGLPVALDESLRDRPIAFFERERELGVVALVLKPTLLGGTIDAQRHFAYSQSSDIAAVASHTLEGPVGFMSAAVLAFSLGSRFAHGLAPHVGLGGVRPPALHPTRDTLIPWKEPGLGLDIDAALAGAEIIGEERF